MRVYTVNTHKQKFHCQWVQMHKSIITSGYKAILFLQLSEVDHIHIARSYTALTERQQLGNVFEILAQIHCYIKHRGWSNLTKHLEKTYDYLYKISDIKDRPYNTYASTKLRLVMNATHHKHLHCFCTLYSLAAYFLHTNEKINKLCHCRWVAFVTNHSLIGVNSEETRCTASTLILLTAKQ